MSRNDAQDFAQRLYARIPANYRAYDTENGQPLLALITVIAAQVANLRQDLDRLWDDFFIETCDDWVVPYLGALVGTNLLQQPVGQSARLDVWNTVLWRRSKGTPKMLQALAGSISGWPADVAEFFQVLGWSQNLNFVRVDRVLSPDLRDSARLGLLGSAHDPFAHSADFKPSCSLDQPPAGRGGVAQRAFGTPGRYRTRNLGVFVRRLQTFAVRGATPAAASPGAAAPPKPSLFTFHPLFRDSPLFDQGTGKPLTGAAFAANPWDWFGDTDAASLAVRQFGIPLATLAGSSPPVTSAPSAPFTFAGLTSGIALDPALGMRLLNARSFQLGAAHFLITAQWVPASGPAVNLGTLSTLLAALPVSSSPPSPAFVAGQSASGAGQLVVTVQLGRTGASFPGLLPSAPACRFPGATIAIRAAHAGALRLGDALYAYLPAAFLNPGDVLTCHVAQDGSTSAAFHSATLTRASEGQVYPAYSASPGIRPAAIAALNRGPAGMVLPDPARFGGAGVVVEAALYDPGSATFQTLGAVTTASVIHPGAAFPDLQVPDPWPAFQYAPSKSAVGGVAPAGSFLTILLLPLAGVTFMPAAELILTDRSGHSLLVYLPEIAAASATGVRVLVADDGSTYFFSPSLTFRQGNLARAAQGQTVPIPGVWPLQQRVPVVANLCRPERASLLAQGELGIDPERGRFAFAPADPVPSLGALTVDYVEALAGAIGANSARPADDLPATRLVSQSGDAASPLTNVLTGAPIHTSLAAAIAAAQNNDVIEIADSATYSAAAAISLGNTAVRNLTIRAAAGQRPCLAFYSSANHPAPASLLISTPMDSLALAGLFVSGGPLALNRAVSRLALDSCTLDPSTAVAASLISADSGADGQSVCTLRRCISGGLLAGPGTGELIVTDSIVDQVNGFAIAGTSGVASPPSTSAAAVVQIERVTVFGRIFCKVLRASECMLDDIAIVQDLQSGCVRFTRYEPGSQLPRRYHCIPDETQLQTCSRAARCLAPVFNSRQFGRPGYAQLASSCANALLTASESGSETGAFASVRNTIRLRNLQTKLREFMPAGLAAVIVAET